MRVSSRRTVLVLCDLWDRHWCQAATEGTVRLAAAINDVVESARRRGIQILHAPSDTMGFYEEWPQRLRTQAIRRSPAPLEAALTEPPLPSHEECVCHPACTPATPDNLPWSRQHASIAIEESDWISDSGAEIYSLIRHLKAEIVCYAGIHTNMCVLTRSFGIRQMLRWQVDVALLRDLTEAIPRQETEGAIEHIERWLCPTLLSQDILL